MHALHNLTSRLWRLPRNTIVLVLSLYQRTLSPDHGPLKHLYPYGYCRHEPTCSQYAKQVLMSRGLIVGSLLALGRVLSCNPFRKPTDERIRSVIAKRLHIRN